MNKRFEDELENEIIKSLADPEYAEGWIALQQWRETELRGEVERWKQRALVAESKVARVKALLDGLCVGHLDHTILQRPCPPCGIFQARLRGALDGDA